MTSDVDRRESTVAERIYYNVAAVLFRPGDHLERERAKAFLRRYTCTTKTALDFSARRRTPYM